MHAAALFAVRSRRAARAAGTGFGATTWARQHRAGFSDVIAHACASRLASAESRLRVEPEPFGAFRAADAGVFFRYDHARMLRDVADNGLAAIPNRHVLHGDGRLATAAIAVERLDLGGKRAGEPA